MIRRCLCPVLVLAMVLAALCSTGVPAATGDVLIASSTIGGVSGTEASINTSISSDGRYVAFSSMAPNLPGSNNKNQIYRKDLQTGNVRLVSSLSDGTTGTGFSYCPEISWDGQFVAFHSNATNFPGYNALFQVYWKNLGAGTLTLVSCTAGGLAGTANSSRYPAMDADGQNVAFQSAADNFPQANGLEQIYCKSMVTGDLVLASSTLAGNVGDEDSTNTDISGDGRYVTFCSSASNFPSSISPYYNIYMKDCQDGDMTLVSCTSGGTPGAENHCSDWTSISSDAGFVAFASDATNFSGHNGNHQIYRKNMTNGTLVHASSDEAGLPATDNCTNSYLSGDGRFMAYVSKAGNLPLANGSTQVYRRDLKVGQFDVVSSNGTGAAANSDCGYPSLSDDGSFGAFFTDAPDMPGANGFDQVYRKEIGPPPVNVASFVYLAEGCTDYGFSEYITVMNPNPVKATIKMTYMTKTGPVTKSNFTMAANSQTTVNPADDVAATDFSTKVECVEGLTIAADRSMSWTGPGTTFAEAHSSIGVTAPAKTWYLPEGSASWGFECWLLIQNPNASAATCQVTYMIENVGPRTVTKTVPANSRQSFNMADDMPDVAIKDASMKVTSNVPVIPERAMYRNNRREGHDSIGTTTPAQDYYLAEGATGYASQFVTYVLVQNPQNSPTDVTVTYMTGAGQKAGPSFTMAANSRKTIKVNDTAGQDQDVSTHVHGSQPVIAERAMYWTSAAGETCHDSIGMDSPHGCFFLPDGQGANGGETWTLVQNPNPSQVTVEFTYMTPSGSGNVTRLATIAANSRRTFNMVDHSGLSGRAAIMVVSKTAGKDIMVERAMYSSGRGVGTDTIGGYDD